MTLSPPPLPDANQHYSGEDDALNDGEVNGNWTPQEKALHEARLKAKAKRRQRKTSRNSTSESFSESGELAGGDPHSPKGKVATNDRKSRTGKGRGLPKKGRVELRSEFRRLSDETLRVCVLLLLQAELAVKESGGPPGWFTRTRSPMRETPTMMNPLR